MKAFKFAQLGTEGTVNFTQVYTHLTFREQIFSVSEKAGTIVFILSRLMINGSGPVKSRRRILMLVTNSVIIYGCEKSVDTLQKESLRRKLAAVQRRGALRIMLAYRTVMETVTLVIVGVIPINLLTFEQKRIFDGGDTLNCAEAHLHTMEDWQEC